MLAQHELLAAALGDLAVNLPRLDVLDDPTALPMTTVADLVRTGALTIHTSAGIAVESIDVVVAAIGPDLRPRVATAADGLGPQQILLRVAPRKLDAHFLAGFLGRSSNYRLVSSPGSTQRLDICRATVPGIPLDRQRAYAAIFDELRAFRERLASTAPVPRKLPQRCQLDRRWGLAAGTLGSQAFDGHACKHCDRGSVFP